MVSLDLDIGNSRVKWCVTQAGMGGSFPSTAILSPDDHPQTWQNVKPDLIRLSSVLSEDATLAAITVLQRRFACELHSAYSSAAAAGVINGYATPERLGVDRWLALLAARQKQAGDLVVVDAGTAITFDLLTSAGEHLGGYILPGVTRQVASLSNGTGRIALQPSKLKPQLEAGKTTQDAVAAAISAALYGLICSAQHQLPGAHWCLTGGDAPWVQTICAKQGLAVTLFPDLVLDGLARCPMHVYPAP